MFREPSSLADEGWNTLSHALNHYVIHTSTPLNSAGNSASCIFLYIANTYVYLTSVYNLSVIHSIFVDIVQCK